MTDDIQQMSQGETQVEPSQASISDEKPAYIGKTLIVCCDGTWMNSDNGYEKPSLLNPKGRLQVPSNVTRISRCFKRRCNDGKPQIVSYESGVGTGSNFLDGISGGAFGLGLSERVREAYSYLCANYIDGDEIILVGFSRGAFTVRSVAGLVSNLGLLTREGVEHFYNIFEDMQNWMNDDYDDPFPTVPFPAKPKGPEAADEYRSRLEKLGFTRVKQVSGELIRIKAVCVWDTVGSLGIPKVGWLDRMGIRADNEDTHKWHDTTLSDRIEHAFQALALDETRPPFSPAVWERTAEDKKTDLRQVWFPGNHGNCGGGWADQGVANCTLAWMMDQLASVGVEFDLPSLDRIFKQSVDYYHSLQTTTTGTKAKSKTSLPMWAVNPIYERNHPLRPWGLGQISAKSSLMYWLSGKTARTPGLYKETDPKTRKDRDRFLQDTNERIHSSVRIRLACKGLDLNDSGVWTCPALQNKWRLKRTENKYEDPVPHHPNWEPMGGEEPAFIEHPGEAKMGRWVWEYAGEDFEGHPDQKQRVMVEEPLGPYERYLLKLAGGEPNVWHFAENKGKTV